ncbi:MAG: thiamine pyrophosphate-binding protein, partial [Tateyamaria sp.]|nr:thiamine pyrophosphate-binding protein [Tateyamaria sp.]
MSTINDTIRLTTAQAIIRWLSNQAIEIDGKELLLCGGGFGIFGHGNVTCLGEALYDTREKLPLYRGQNEQSMGFAAAGYAKQWLRQRFMFCTASAGPGTSNLLTSAALANANRLPMLLLCRMTNPIPVSNYRLKCVIYTSSWISEVLNLLQD